MTTASGRKPDNPGKEGVSRAARPVRSDQREDRK